MSSSSRSRSGSGSGNRLVLVAVAAVFLVALGAALFAGDPDDDFDLDAIPAAEITQEGTSAPVATGAALLGEGEVTVPVEGEPTLIVFLAHWCPACNAELPVLEQWLADGGLPEGVQLRAVTTGIDPLRDNYPPDRWLERQEWWDVPTLVDTDGTVAQAFQLDAYPYWFVVDADGDVVTNGSGQLEPADITRLAESALG